MLPVMAVRDAWRDVAYRASLGSAFANGWANFGVRNAILPLFAAVVIGKEPWVAGTALAVFAAGNAIGLTVSGRLSDRVGRRPFIVGGLVDQRAGDDRHRVRLRPARAGRALRRRRGRCRAC